MADFHEGKETLVSVLAPLPDRYVHDVFIAHLAHPIQ